MPKPPDPIFFSKFLVADIISDSVKHWAPSDVALLLEVTWKLASGSIKINKIKKYLIPSDNALIELLH